MYSFDNLFDIISYFDVCFSYIVLLNMIRTVSDCNSLLLGMGTAYLSLANFVM